MSGSRKPSFGRTMAAFWTYTLLRFGIFFALWAILWFLGIEVYLAGVIAVLLSVPLSLVLLARPRTALGRVIEDRVNVHASRKAAFDAKLQGADDPEAWGQPSADDKRH